MANMQQNTGKPITPPVVNSNINENELEKLLKIEQLKALQRQNAEAEALEMARLEALELEKTRKKELVRALEQEQMKEMKRQEQCNHMYKGQTVLAGLGTWDSHIPYFVCQSCLKEWHKEYPPQHLLPESGTIGRPQVS